MASGAAGGASQTCFGKTSPRQWNPHSMIFARSASTLVTCLVVLDHGGIRRDVDRGRIDARHVLQLLLDALRVENRQHAADFQDSCLHVSLLIKLAIVSALTPTRRCSASGRWAIIFSPRRHSNSVSAALDGLACPRAAGSPGLTVLFWGSAAASPPQQPWPDVGAAAVVRLRIRRGLDSHNSTPLRSSARAELRAR